MARVTHVKHAQQRYETKPVMVKGKPKVVPVLRRDGSPKLTKNGRPITRRVTVEDRTKPKPPRKCERCGKVIKVSVPAKRIKGDPYKWVKPKSGPYGGSMRVRCANCPTWTQSELSSSKMATAYAAQEAAEASLNAASLEVDDAATYEDLASAAESFVEELQGYLTDCAEGYRECAQDYQEGIDAMPESLQESAYDSQEKVSNLEEAADTLDNWDAPSVPDDDPELDDEDRVQGFRDWADEARDSAVEAIYELSV